MKNNNNENKTCYQCVFDTSVPCPETDCRHWLNSSEELNCSIIAAKSGPKTLQQIGDYYGISRMRVCQIEKSILKKLRRDSKAISPMDPLSGEQT